MKQSGSTSIWARWLAFASFVLIALSSTAWASAVPVQVWVQPSGDTFANAYALVGEARTYFGRAEGGSGAYNYTWTFDDGVGNTSGAVGDPRYINVDNKTFTTAGTHTAILTVTDANDAGNFASAQVTLQVVSTDDLGRQKNSAIDRGLRNIYLNENVNGNQSYWNGSSTTPGATGMALVAFENQGHNLQSADSDIYKKSVQRGIQYELENASLSAVDDQRCIGNPETATTGDTIQDGQGVVFGSDYLYGDSQAMLALVNSADKAFAQSTLASTGNALNGLSLYQIAIQAKDWLAWAQGDGGGGGSYVFCSAPGNGFNIYYSGSGITSASGYFYSGDIASLGGCNGNFNFDWGDGTTSSYADSGVYCGYNGANTAYPELNYATTTAVTHSYAASGDYTVSMGYTGNADPANPITTALCNVSVPITATGAACGAADAANGAGGWRYNSNFSDSDNSVTQWPALALNEAKNRWGIDTNQAVKDMLGYWLGYSACSNGGYGYTSGDSSGWCNFPKSAGAMISLSYAGKLLSDSSVQNDLAFLSGDWNSSGYDHNFDNLYSMYAFYKGMKVWGITDIGSTTNTGQAWEQQYDQHLIANQNSDGSWTDNGSWMDSNFATYAAVAILAPSVASLPPVANAGAPYPTISPNQVLQLDGTKSYHKDPSKQIVLYQWDFNAADGLWWTTKPAPGAGEGAVGSTPTVSYPDVGHNQSYTVTLRVTDNTTPTPMTASDTATVNVSSGEVPPVAKTNGPWTGTPNTPITFDASASYDPNACTTAGNPACLGDSIVKYEWDLNGDGIFNNPDGSDGNCLNTHVNDGTCPNVQVTKSFPNPISLPASLRVTDSYGQTSTTTATNNIVSIALVYGTNYQTCYKTALNPPNRFQSLNGLKVMFENQGNGTANNLTMTLTSAPSNVTIVHGTTSLGNVGAGAEVSSACNPTAKTADIVIQTDSRIPATGGWSWTADFDFNSHHYTVTGIPPLGP